MRDRLEPYIETLVIAALYFLAAKFGLAFAVEVPQVSAVWPPSGIALAALLVCGIRRWPAVALGAFLTYVSDPIPFYAVLGIAAGNTLEAVLGAAVLRRAGFCNALERGHDVMALMLLAGIVPTALAAAIGSGVLRLGGTLNAATHFHAFLRWWTGSTAAVWGVTPLLLTWAAKPRVPRERRVEAITLIIAVALVSYIVLVRHQHVRFLILPLLAWSAARLSQKWTALACFVVTAVAVWAASMGIIAFAVSARNPEESLGYMLLFTGVTSLTALMLGALFIEWRRIADENHLKNKQLELALSAGRVGVWEWDLRSNAITWSRNLINLHWMRPQDVPCNFEQYFATILPADRERVKSAIDAAVRQRSVFRIEYRAPRADGALIWYEGQGELITDASGAPVSMIGVCADITERKRAEEELRRSGAELERLVAARTLELRESEQRLRLLVEQLAEEARRKDQFLAVLAHELRNPMAPIRNAVELLKRPGHTAAHAARACEIISRQVKHMVRLVDDLLDVARVSHGKILLHTERLDLLALLRSVIDEHRSDFVGHNLRIDEALPPHPVWVDGDPARMVQVFDNLLQNAVKFTPPGGRVSVAAVVLEGENAVQITVSDSGIGMDPATIKMLFEPFTQADQSLDRSAGGLGLGLALSRQLLALHGARIEAFSRGIGQGSEFRIWFPLADTSITHAKPVSLDQPM